MRSTPQVITGGYGSLADQKFNIFGGISYSKQEALAATSRDFAKTAYIPSRGVDKRSPHDLPGELLPGDRTTSTHPSLPDCTHRPRPRRAASAPLTTCPSSTSSPSRSSGPYIAKGSYAVNKNNTISLEYLQANNSVSTRSRRRRWVACRWLRTIRTIRVHRPARKSEFRPDATDRPRLAPDRAEWPCLRRSRTTRTAGCSPGTAATRAGTTTSPRCSRRPTVTNDFHRRLRQQPEGERRTARRRTAHRGS